VGIFGTDVEVAPDAAAASWLRPRLGPFGTVGGLVPDGFEHCVLVRPEPRDTSVGDPDVELAGALAALARPHTRTPESIWYAFWEGYGWETGTTMYLVAGKGPLGRLHRWWFRRRRRALDRRRNETVRRELAEVPTFDLPDRRYHLLRGPLTAASRIARPTGSGHQAADLWWPEDRSWFVATDTDLDWVYVGGTAAFVDHVLAAFPDRSEPVRRSAAN
jgi:hypothetical protein